MKNHFFLATILLLAVWSCDAGKTSEGYQELDEEAFKAKMAEPGVVLLDVRTPEETAQGMIAGAGQLDFEANGFEAEVDKLDKSKTYLVYCRAGSRSGKACDLMAQKGFKNLYSLKGGYMDWQK